MGAAIGFLVRPSNPAYEFDKKEIEAAAVRLGIRLDILTVANEEDFEGAFAAASRAGVSAIMVHTDPFFNSNREKLVGLAARHALPTLYELREFVVAGGLMSYGTSITAAYQQAGTYAGRILKGEKPADLPVIQSSRFEMAINLKTAKALGLTIPQNVLVAADEVIE
jgi:putative ABC transport system substrate-binding protein